jgi:hypothetical protein
MSIDTFRTLINDLTWFYYYQPNSLSERPNKTDSLRARRHAHALYHTLLQRCQSLHEPPPPTEWAQLQRMYVNLINMIHRKYKTQQTGDYTDTPK